VEEVGGSEDDFKHYWDTLPEDRQKVWSFHYMLYSSNADGMLQPGV